VRILLVGYGRMGRTVERLARADGHEVVGRVDPGGAEGTVWPLERAPLELADVAIEFTTPAAAPDGLVALAEAGLDTVSGTTGWGEALPRVADAVRAAGTGLLYASNFSLGVALFLRAARALAGLVDGVGRAGERYDVAIHEVHHRHKLDHPSGTAVSLAEAVLGALPAKQRWAAGPPSGAADPSVLHVTSARVGEVPGSHALLVEGRDDRIELRHDARGREGFARGALAAAAWVRGRHGVFTLDDLLAEAWSGATDAGAAGSGPAPRDARHNDDDEDEDEA